MIKPSLKNILLYILVKYLIFYIITLFKIGDFKYLQVSDLKTFDDWYMYIWTILLLPVVNMLLFSAPLYFSYRLSGICFILATIAIIVAEYFVFVFFTSGRHIDMNGVYNGTISIVVLLFFFYRSMLDNIINPQ